MALPPGPRGPAIVNTVRFARRPLDVLSAWHARYGDAFTVKLAGFGTGVYVVDPDAIRALFTGDQSDLHAGEANSFLVPMLGPHSVLVLDGPEHLRQRKRLLPPFQGSRVAVFREVIRDVAQREVASWRPGERLVLRERMRGLTFEVICRAVFGVTETDRVERLRAALGAVIDSSTIYLAVPAARKDLGPLSPGRRFARRLAAADALLYEEIALRRREPDLEERTDVLSLLLRARDEDGASMTDAELRDELFTMLGAGYETTATGLAFAFDLLLRNPAALARLREEIAAGESDAYLDAVVKETLRLRPVIDAAERTLTAPRTIAGWELPAGMKVYPGIALVHLREDLYPRAGVPPGALRRRRRRVLLVDPLRRRDPALHRRRARPGRDGRGAAHRGARRGAAAAARGAGPGRPAGHHAGAQARRGGGGREQESRAGPHRWKLFGAPRFGAVASADSHHPAEEARDMNASAIDLLLQQAADERTVPGVIAVAGDRDGTIYEGAFGVLSVDGDEPAKVDTTIWIASMTKALASTGALQLIEQGELALEQPVADVIPAFGELQVLEGFDGDTPRLSPPTTQATIRHLLTHTSGLSYWFGNPDILRYHEVSGIPNPFAGKRSLFEMPLVVDPGTRWEYGISTDWLGQVIEAVSGEDLAAYCAEYIFGPLAMTDTSFTPTDEQRARSMQLHARKPDGGLALAPFEPPADPEYWSGGAGASSTGPDYLRFMRAMLRGGELDGERILRPETVDLAFTDHLAGAPFPEIVHSAIPELSNDIVSMPVSQGFGLGFHLVHEDLPGMRRAGTGDWAGLANTYYWIDRATGVAGTFLTQVLPFFDERILGAAIGFEQGVYAEVGAPAAA